MGLFDFLKGKKIEDRFAISLDIGTEFVKALIFEVEKDKAKVLGVGRYRQKLSDMQGGMVTDISGVIQNCQAAIEIAGKQAKIIPRQVIVGIAGELVKGMTTRIKYIRENSKINISMPELKEVISKVQKVAFDKARSVLAWETGRSEIDVKLVNAAVVDVKIDGYKVTNPLGFQGKEIEVGVYSAFAPIVHLGALQTIAEALDLDLLSVVAEPYAVARCLANATTSDFSAIFIDMGGGTSDIALVRQGGLEGTKMFALGGRAFTKRLAEVFYLSFGEAEEVKLDYSTGKMQEQAKIAKVKQALFSDCQVWLSAVELTLEEFGEELLPTKILLCGGGSSLPDIAQVLENSSWYANLPFPKKPQILFIKPTDVTSVVDTTGKLKQLQDVTPMALANLAISLVGQETIFDSILSKLINSVKT